MWSKIDLYEARHAAPVAGLDPSAFARRTVDSQRVRLAVRLLASVDTPQARTLYRELHWAGALYPQAVPSQPVVLDDVQAVA